MESPGATTFDDLDVELNELADHLDAQHARLVGACTFMLNNRLKWAGPGTA